MFLFLLTILPQMFCKAYQKKLKTQLVESENRRFLKNLESLVFFPKNPNFFQDCSAQPNPLLLTKINRTNSWACLTRNLLKFLLKFRTERILPSTRVTLSYSVAPTHTQFCFSEDDRSQGWWSSNPLLRNKSLK